ncbi:unnamed protein product, partial [Amoebophrya sp. A25]|eukprot:GSA25T00021396001.1
MKPLKIGSKANHYFYILEIKALILNEKTRAFPSDFVQPNNQSGTSVHQYNSPRTSDEDKKTDDEVNAYCCFVWATWAVRSTV